MKGISNDHLGLTMDSQDMGSPSKLSRRRRIDDKSTIRTSKRDLKVSIGLFLLSVYVGVYFQGSYKRVNNFLQVTIEEANVMVAKTSAGADPTSNGGNVTTLALLYPPGMMGGYRNQVLRFIAFVVHAKEKNITQILLPSVLWTTKMIDPGFNHSKNDDNQSFQRDFPIPFDWVFDVDHWNKYHEHLPLLVTPDRMISSSMFDCWIQSSELRDIHQLHNATSTIVDTNMQNTANIFYYMYDRSTKNKNDTNTNVIYINHLQRAVLMQGMIRPIANDVTIPILTNQLTINPRLHNFAPDTDHCTNPRVHGGGKKAGVLWNAYISYIKTAAKAAASTPLTGEGDEWAMSKRSTRTNTSFVPFNTDVWIYQALQPAEMWRTVAMKCIQSHASSGKYIALHARIELEMMEHICGSGMEKNLTKILDQVYKLYGDQRESLKSSISAIFIAVSRDGIALTNNYRKSWFRPIAIDNLRTLDQITQGSPSASILPAFECGEKVLEQFYSINPSIPNHGTLLQSVINFYIAVSSEIFVGVAHSSYSTDILTTRYWLGKGSSNYRYTTGGIEQVENGGLPVPHSNCQKNRPSPKADVLQ